MDDWMFAGMGYSEEDDEDDDDDEDYESGDECEEDGEHREQVPVSTFCGLRRNFLIESRELPGGGSAPGLTHTQTHAGPITGSAEEAERIGRELVDEEEKVKRKAEKRRLKKKRQKERRRQQKQERKTLETAPDQRQKDSLKESDEEEGPEEEDDWDMSSSFVSKAASQIQRKLNLRSSTERRESKTQGPDAVTTQIMELAVQGNRLANEGQYAVAVSYFTKAIKYNQKEYRLFGNRSYCYERLTLYDKALNDAEIAIRLNPSWAKGHFRKARAHAGKKNYAQAVEAYREVLRIDSSCADAKCELLQVQMRHLMELGLTEQQCLQHLATHGSLDGASLPAAGRPGNSTLQTSLYVSDDEDRDFVQVTKSSGPQRNKASSVPAQLHTRELFPIWIGNITARITEETLQRVFSTVGDIHSMRLLPERFCAFINFTTREGVTQAIAQLQGIELLGTRLVIRHPDNKHHKMATPAPVAWPAGSESPSSGANAGVHGFGRITGNQATDWRPR